MSDLFTSLGYFQVYNFYRNPDAKRGEKVLRTYGDRAHCEEYIKKYGKWLEIEPYDSDEWNHPKMHECCILPLEKFDEEK